MRKTYVFRDGRWVDVADMATAAPAGPYIMDDLAPYQSMATGEMITSRSRHREHLKAHGLIEVGNETKHLKPSQIQDLKGLKQDLIDICHSKLRYK